MGFEIFNFDLDEKSGHPQSGQRPGIIIGYSNKVFTIIPVTTSAKAFGYNYIYAVQPDTTNKLRYESTSTR